MRLDPATLPRPQCRAVDDWLVANGCRYHVALEPVTIKGNQVEFFAMCRRDLKSTMRARVRDFEQPKLRRLRIRTGRPDLIRRLRAAEGSTA